MLTNIQKVRIKNNLSTFKIVTEITGVPTEALLTLWYLKGLKMSDPFEIDANVWTEQAIIERLNKFSRLSDRDVRKLAGFPVHSFVLSLLLASVSLVDRSPIGIYPDMHLDAVQAALAAYLGAFDTTILGEMGSIIKEFENVLPKEKRH